MASSLFPALDSALIESTNGTANIDGIKSGIINAEHANTLDSLNSAGDNSSSTLTYGMYLSRNKTISDIASDLTKQNAMVRNSGASDTYTRQGEINEWQAQNKLDTLFFFQCLFIYLIVFILFLFLRRYNIIPSFTFYMFTGIITLVIFGILWNRASYTENSRDKRYWNRRYLGLSAVFGNPGRAMSSCSAAKGNEATSYTNSLLNGVGKAGAYDMNNSKEQMKTSYYNYIFGAGPDALA